MTMPLPVGAPPVDANGVRDFTIKREPHRFRIDDDVFSAPPIMSPVALKRLAVLHGELGEITPERVGEIVDKVADMFLILLPGQSGQRFVERMKDEDLPLDIEGQVIPIVYWLLEQYGLRPTAPSLDSSTGSTEPTTATPSDGEFSTDGASPTDSEIILS